MYTVIYRSAHDFSGIWTQKKVIKVKTSSNQRLEQCIHVHTLHNYLVYFHWWHSNGSIEN